MAVPRYLLVMGGTNCLVGIPATQRNPYSIFIILFRVGLEDLSNRCAATAVSCGAYQAFGS